MAENNFQNLVIFNSLLLKDIWTNPMPTDSSSDFTLDILWGLFFKAFRDIEPF